MDVFDIRECRGDLCGSDNIDRKGRACPSNQEHNLMFLYLIPLLMGFAFNSASAFTTYYSRRLGERGGRLVSTILRDILGIPVWAIGYVMAVRTPSTLLYNPVFITSALGWLLILAGGVIIIVGLMSLRWRAVAPSVQDTLMNQGGYAYIRHPLYSGMMLGRTCVFF